MIHFLIYRKVASSRPDYYSILETFGQYGQKRTRRILNNEFLTLSVKLQPILTKRQLFGHYWTIQISVHR